MDEPVDLDEHRGMAAQKQTEIRRLLHEVQANQTALRARQDPGLVIAGRSIAPSHASAEIIPMRENENTIATRSTEATGSTRKHFTISGWPINSTKERHVRRRERCLALRQR